MASVSLVSPLQALFLCLFCEGSEGWFLLDPYILLIHWRHALKFRARGLLSGRDNRGCVAALTQECRHLLVLTWPLFSIVQDICAEMFLPDFAKFPFVIRMCSSLASLIRPVSFLRSGSNSPPVQLLRQSEEVLAWIKHTLPSTFFKKTIQQPRLFPVNLLLWRIFTPPYLMLYFCLEFSWGEE